jgi:hypothetical protein
MNDSGSPGWRRKVMAVLVMAAVAPLAVAISTRTTVALITPVVPYAITMLVLIGIYRLVLRGWWWRYATGPARPTHQQPPLPPCKEESCAATDAETVCGQAAGEQRVPGTGA